MTTIFNPRQQLVYNTTSNVLEFYPPEIIGLPEFKGSIITVTAKVYDDTADLDDAAEETITATRDNVATTFNAAAGFSQASNRNRCPLAATTDIVQGVYYGIEDSYRRREYVRVWRVDAGVSIDAEGPLAYDYVSGDEFFGIRWTAPLSSGFMTDENNIGGWKVLWSYDVSRTTNTVQFRHWTYFDVVRQKYTSSVAGIDLYSSFPDLRHEQYGDLRGQDWQHLIDRAQRRVEFDLRNYGIALDAARTNDFDELILSRAKWELASGGWAPNGREVELFVEQMERHYFNDLRNLKDRAEIDTGSSGSVTAKGSQKLTFTR